MKTVNAGHGYDSGYKAGAKYELGAVLSKLKRELRRVEHLCKPFEVEILHDLEQWIVARKTNMK